MRVRGEIDLPDGGLSNPCALTYSPGVIMAIPRRSSASRRGSGGPGGGPAQGITAGGAPRTATVAVASGAASGPGLETVSGGLIGTGGPSDSAPVLGAPGLSGSWAWNIPEDVKLPANNDTLAFMTVCVIFLPSPQLAASARQAMSLK